jgi:hypothetical protein
MNYYNIFYFHFIKLKFYTHIKMKNGNHTVHKKKSVLINSRVLTYLLYMFFISHPSVLVVGLMKQDKWIIDYTYV